MKKSILMITPESKEIYNFRKNQFNNFIQITMPYLAGFIDESCYDITLIDDIIRRYRGRNILTLLP